MRRCAANRLLLALLAAALLEIHHRSAEQITGSKLLWTGLALVTFVGRLAGFRFGRKR